MKLSSQHFKARAKGPLHVLECINLSRLEIGSYDKLALCPKLHAVNLSRNEIDFVSSFDGCPQLWKIDLSNNKISNLEGLTRFVALGSLFLCNNDLSWSELSKIRHMHILNLSLHGNPQLEKDPYYRIHVIDCLPNVWMLDGRIVTSAERLQVRNFFDESALTDRPVRHKLSKEQFIPTSRKKLAVTGLFGHRTDHLMRRFPTNGPLNIETDHRRILYLAYNLQEDLLVEAKYSNRNWGALSARNTCFEDVLKIRDNDRVRCNMLLLLLVASLEFAIPSHLMQEALNCAKLGVIGNVDSMELFLLPKEVRCDIVSLLLSAVKVDKDSGEEGGLYDKLYLCLYNSVSELTRLAQGGSRSNNSRQALASEKMSKCLIASEVVQLLCIVPAFFSYITKDSGVMNLVTMATSDLRFVDRVEKLIQKMEQNKWEVKKIYENISELIVRAIQDNTAVLVKRKQKQATKENYVLNTSTAGLKRPKSSPIFASKYHMTGRPSPDRKAVRLKSGKPYRGSYIPQAKLGDKILLGPQNIARVISIPEPEMVLVQMDVVPDETGAMISNKKAPEEHYKYIDVNHLYWDYMACYWRPLGTIGDRITMKTDTEQEADLVSQAQKLATKDSPKEEVTVATPRSATTPLPSARIAKKEDTRAVSARYKESQQLRLELGEDGNDSNKSKEDEDDQLSYGPPPSRAKSAVSRPMSQRVQHKVKTRAVLSDPEDGEEDELLYSQSRMSHDSSLASDEEPELKEIQDSRPSSRPGTAAKPRVRMPSESSQAPVTAGTPENPIEIPQVDAESLVTSTQTQGSDTSHNKPSKPELGTVESESEGRETEYGLPQTDVSMDEDTASSMKESIDPVTIGLVSSTERQLMAEVVRTEVDIPHDSSARDLARNSPLPSPLVLDVKDNLKTKGSILVSSRPGSGFDHYARSRAYSPHSSIKPETPPPQRPPSPSLLGQGKKSHIPVQHGSTWLGGGRDLHWENKPMRPKSGHVPGWKEGLNTRPKSAAAARAMRRSKTPNIITPSSIAYDDAYGKHKFPSSIEVDQYYRDLESPYIMGSHQPYSHSTATPTGRRLGPTHTTTTHTQHGYRQHHQPLTPTPVNSRPTTPQNSCMDLDINHV